MDSDLVLTIGLILAVLTLPSLLGAWVEGRGPRLGAILLLTAAVMIGAAVISRPGGYHLPEIPSVMLGVIGRYL